MYSLFSLSLRKNNYEIPKSMSHDILPCCTYKDVHKVNLNKMCHKAIEYGHLECLKYAHKNGCFLAEHVCDFAAEKGHLELLKYMHENGCEWAKQLKLLLILER